MGEARELVVSGKPTRKERKIAAFAQALEQDERTNLPPLPAWANGCNLAEGKFAQRAVAKGLGGVHRAGWPDFLIEEPGGGIYAVEVKTDADEIRPNQATMFTALDTNGVRVYVWNPRTPGRLVPWRTYIERSGQGAREERRRLREPSRSRAREKYRQPDRVVNSKVATTVDRAPGVE